MLFVFVGFKDASNDWIENFWSLRSCGKVCGKLVGLGNLQNCFCALWKIILALFKKIASLNF